MKKFIFIYNKKSYKLIEDKNINNEEIEGLINRGLVKINIEAKDQKEAIKKAQEMTGVNTNSLKEFGKDISFAAIIESLLR